MAFKIFELGLKKYGDIPEYILAYIDYLSHLNGKNVGAVFPVQSINLNNINLDNCVFFHVICLQRTTTPGFCLNESSPQEACHQKSQGNDER